MKKIILCLLITFLLSGCYSFYDLSDYVMPNDAEFLEVIERENTPRKFCNYMQENYVWELHFSNYSPYQMWLANVKTKAGDCNDMSCAIVFAMDYNEYETYQILVYFKNSVIAHALAVFVEDGKYTYSSNQYYHPIYVNTFREIVDDYFTYQSKEYKSYKVYNYDNDLIERGR